LILLTIPSLFWSRPSAPFTKRTASRLISTFTHFKLTLALHSLTHSFSPCRTSPPSIIASPSAPNPYLISSNRQTTKTNPTPETFNNNHPHPQSVHFSTQLRIPDNPLDSIARLASHLLERLLAPSSTTSVARFSALHTLLPAPPIFRPLFNPSIQVTNPIRKAPRPNPIRPFRLPFSNSL
jgi:hypothetical protein